MSAPVTNSTAIAPVERHRSALAALAIASIAADEVAAELEGRAISPADEAAADATNAEYEAAVDGLVEPPSTIAGLRALLEYIAMLDDGTAVDLDVRDIAASLLRSPALAN